MSGFLVLDCKRLIKNRVALWKIFRLREYNKFSQVHHLLYSNHGPLHLSRKKGGKIPIENLTFGDYSDTAESLNKG